MAIVFNQHGDFSKTSKYLNGLKSKNYRPILERYANQGLSLLQSATPKDSGETASSWSYKVFIDRARFGIKWYNSHNTDTGVPIVILLQYGHGTTGGTFVEGRDFINVTMRPLFEQLSNDIWKEVTNV